MGICNRRNVIAWAKVEEGCKMAVTMSINKAQKKLAKLALKQPRNLCEKLQRTQGQSTASFNITPGSKEGGNLSSAQLYHPPSPTNITSFPTKTTTPYGLVTGVNSDCICKYN